MVFNQREEICPVCGEKARLTRKWVVNKYGKRYDYFIYNHEGHVHYSNQGNSKSKKFKKGQLEKILIETINSQDFKLGSFRIRDLKKLLIKNYPEIGFGSIKESLNRLSDVGIIEKQRKGRSLIFVNTVSKDRLSYVIDSLTVSLEDKNDDAMFTRHLFQYKIRNDHSWPLYYVPFRAVGDVDSTFSDLGMRASDPSNSKEIKVMSVEDTPTDKRVLLKLPSPLMPEDVRDLSIEYNWPEPKQLFVYSSATKMNSFEFWLSGNSSTRLSISLTPASRNETLDLTNRVIETSSQRWKYICGISLKDVEPFSVLQLRWKQS
ncbi:MAG: hypothetical protein M1556_04915 [Candidatus Thermoplasmatota archaeon]|jgi:hypothetical protein|nr:hypothetical protein [Candidatus Thermoplasmatota archaeon]MCL6002968.1 hypothetical protein [Candidatus Thermoplasmatota archaeon]